MLLNATLLFGVGAVIMTPDTPLLFFWTCCLWALARLLRGWQARLLVAGGRRLFAGLAMASKYTAALLWFGIALWLLVTPSHAVLAARGRRPGSAQLLGGRGRSCRCVLWNADHGWASFARQGGRVGELASGRCGRASSAS